MNMNLHTQLLPLIYSLLALYGAVIVAICLAGVITSITNAISYRPIKQQEKRIAAEIPDNQAWIEHLINQVQTDKYSVMSIRELKAEARNRAIKNYGYLRKDQLIGVLTNES